jgi:hypothetical protein
MSLSNSDLTHLLLAVVLLLVAADGPGWPAGAGAARGTSQWP